ncbi:hypothetical protein [Streptomyces sp. NPDC005209]|uniref:hypothetical protein n=1 Tax=Streptomyces sp. NPDC005209 TaxID=3156715 RepID=UPI0033AB76E0
MRSGNRAAGPPAPAGDAEVRPDWAQAAGRMHDEATDDWNDQVAVDRLVGQGGRLPRDRGRLDGCAG